VPTLITTEFLGEPPRLSEISTDHILSTSWIRGGDGLIGFGVYARTTVTGPNRFVEARKWWRDQLSKFSIHNNVHGSGTGPILFTSFSFLETSDSELVIPEIVIGQKMVKLGLHGLAQDLNHRLNNFLQRNPPAQFNGTMVQFPMKIGKVESPTP